MVVSAVIGGLIMISLGAVISDIESQTFEPEDTQHQFNYIENEANEIYESGQPTTVEEENFKQLINELDYRSTVEFGENCVDVTLESPGERYNLQCLPEGIEQSFSAEITWTDESDWSNVASLNRVINEEYPGGDRTSDFVTLGYDSSLSNLISYWPMDEQTGPLTDVISGNSGIVDGVNLEKQGILSSTGIEVEENNDKFQIERDSEFQSTRYAYSFWIYDYEGPKGDFRTIIWDEEQNRYPGVWLQTNDNRLHLDHTTGDSDWWNTAGEIPENQWTHVVVNVHGDDRLMEVFFDGELDSDYSQSSDPEEPGDTDIHVGQSEEDDSRGGEGFYMDEMMYFDEPLDEEQVSKLYQTSINGTLVTDWRSSSSEIEHEDLVLQAKDFELNGGSIDVVVQSDEEPNNDEIIDLDESVSEYNVPGITETTDQFRAEIVIETSSSSSNAPRLGEISIGTYQDIN